MGTLLSAAELQWAKDAAAHPIEPWTRKGDHMPPSNEEWHEMVGHLVSMRVGSRSGR